VRLSDGYFFPAPNSQFAGYGDYDGTLDRCRFICQDMEMEVYVRDDVAQESEALRPLRGGTPYRDLPVAFGYAGQPAFRSCNFARYLQRSIQLEVRSKNGGDAPVPLPMHRPEPSPSNVQLSAASGEAGPGRKVRVVGEPFLPDAK
jgi:hypothetical protein